jgi:hypothetical protein
MAFALIAVGGLGLPEAMMDNVFSIWSFGSYLVPLAVYEGYRRARAPGGRPGAMAAVLAGLTLVMAAGIVGATLMMWLPPLQSSGLFG